MVMTIISIMAAAVFVSLQGSRTHSDVRAAAREVAGVIRSVQNDALSGKDAKGCSGAASGKYVFNYDAAGTYAITGCNAQSAVTLPEHIVFDSSGSMYFLPVTGKPGSASTVSVRKSSVIYSVCVSAVGKVEEVEGDSSQCPAT